MIGRKAIVVTLSKLKQIREINHSLEQYQTPGEIATDWMDIALDDISGKTVMDAGCGNGILGIGALLCGAKKVIFIDKDLAAIETAKENVNSVGLIEKAEFVCEEMEFVKKEVDTVLTNPPFGTKQTHADRIFLQSSMNCAKVVYTMHKWVTRGFVEAFVKDNKREVTNIWYIKFPIKQTHIKHEKRLYFVEVGLFKIK